jgi:hypothetical protein
MSESILSDIVSQTDGEQVVIYHSSASKNYQIRTLSSVSRSNLFDRSLARHFLDLRDCLHYHQLKPFRR